MIQIICKGMDLKSKPEACSCCICTADIQGSGDTKSSDSSDSPNGFYSVNF